ncbi:CaiB/BaiF CoA-transferase family protein [Solibacillus sp. FSL W8-0474]|uniref:CaiB/BaiF CoA transferase family protein n=1 Tax=Solibacillus sp. FSL W8-0474 TaxID=2975336 RepID=UPI0030FB1E0C
MLKPFAGVKVLDLTEGVAGPYAAMMLGDLGAEVYKVERPEGDWGRILGTVKDGFSSQYIALNRNKKNISLNTQSIEGQEIFKKLASSVEIIITSFRPGVTEKYGLGYEDIKKITPNIIYGRISGYGYKGKNKLLTGVDTVIQANSGIMNHIGPTDGTPYRTGFPIVDHVAARDLVQGIQAAYITKLKTNHVAGPIDVSLYATAAALQAQQWQEYFLNGKVPHRTGNFNPVIVPSAVYETKDNRYISIAVVREKQWERFCEMIDLEELLSDERFQSNELRLKNRVPLEGKIIQQIKLKTREEWLMLCVKNDITHAPVLDMNEIYHSDYFEAIPLTNFRMNNEVIKSIGMPFVYNGEIYQGEQAPPVKTGENSLEILRSLNYTTEDIAALVEKGIIAVSDKVKI